MKSIAVIGTGIMGHGIATNFLAKGYNVFVWNRSAVKVGDLVAKGAVNCASPSEATLNADIIFEVTANDESSREVWCGKKGILAVAKSSQFLITCATLSLSWTEELVTLCSQRKIVFFDMPMTGSRFGAESGQLTLLVGGNEKKLEIIRTDLKAIAADVLYFGKTGNGMKYKLILNTLQAIHLAGFGETMRMAEELNLDVTKVGNALAEKPGGVVTKMAWRDYQVEPVKVNFSVELITKDLKYMQQANERASPLLDAALKVYQGAVKKGYGKNDWTKINKVE